MLSDSISFAFPLPHLGVQQQMLSKLRNFLVSVSYLISDIITHTHCNMRNTAALRLFLCMLKDRNPNLDGCCRILRNTNTGRFGLYENCFFCQGQDSDATLVNE
jgi:hypothetical protein